MNLNIVECRKCGSTYWFSVEKSGPVAGGPCCFGHQVLDVDHYPTESLARKAWTDWVASKT